MDNSNRQSLDVLLGRHLSSVTFVMDYVQLDFDGARLTAITPPVVSVAGSRFAWGQHGYRDMLCERISESVRSAVVMHGEEIRIEFESGASITISLHPEDYRAAEAATLIVGSDWWVW